MGDVAVEHQGHVMLLRLSRPEHHNAIGGSMLRELGEAFELAARNDAVRVVVTTGEGASFCVGADVTEFPNIAGSSARELLSGDVIGGDKGLEPLSPDARLVDDLGNSGRVTRRLWALEKPTIAAVNGAAVGGGLALALLHDIRIAASNAKIGTALVPLGLVPELGISYVLPRVVGWSLAAELLYSGRMLSGGEAASVGLVSSAVPADDVLPRALEIAERIAAAPSLALMLTKRLLRDSPGNRLEDQLRAEHAAQLLAFDHPPTREILGAAAERFTRRRPKPS